MFCESRDKCDTYALSAKLWRVAGARVLDNYYTRMLSGRAARCLPLGGLDPLGHTAAALANLLAHDVLLVLEDAAGARALTRSALGWSRDPLTQHVRQAPTSKLTALLDTKAPCAGNASAADDGDSVHCMLQRDGAALRALDDVLYRAASMASRLDQLVFTGSYPPRLCGADGAGAGSTAGGAGTGQARASAHPGCAATARCLAGADCTCGFPM